MNAQATYIDVPLETPARGGSQLELQINTTSRKRIAASGKFWFIALLSCLVIVEPVRAGWFTHFKENFHKHPIRVSLEALGVAVVLIGVGVITFGSGDAVVGAGLAEVFADAEVGTSASVFNSTATAEEATSALEADGFEYQGLSQDGKAALYEDASGNKAAITPSNSSSEGAFDYTPNGGDTIRIHLGMSD